MIMTKKQVEAEIQKSLSYEVAVKKLESLVDLLETGELSLDESLLAFEDGMKLAQFCESKLNEASGRVEKIMKNFSNGEKVELFAEDELSEDNTLGDDDDL